MDVDAIEHCKENIQPLKQGRRTSQLQIAIQAETDSKIHQELVKQRECYELAILTYEGDDPLAPRWEYLCWLEQAFPKHASVLPLIESTISTFKTEPKYRNDPRFVKILIKYIENQSNSIELYQTVFSEGLGTMCSYLYKAWAEALDSAGDLRRADQVYQQGISNRAEPTEELRQAHMLFQLSVGRRMLRGEVEDNEKQGDVCPPRVALGRLGSKKVGSVRASHSEPGSLRSTMKTPLSNKNSAVKVFQDDEENLLPKISGCKLNFNPSKQTTKENRIDPGPWNKSYNKKSAQQLPCTPKTPSFKVHEDRTIDENKHPVAHTPHALRTRKEEFHCPLAVFEPEDPSVMPMYCKQKIYGGGGELQLEEIRAAIYNKKYYETVYSLHLNPMESLSSFVTPAKPPDKQRPSAFEISLDHSSERPPNTVEKFKIYTEEYPVDCETSQLTKTGRELTFDTPQESSSTDKKSWDVSPLASELAVKNERASDFDVFKTPMTLPKSSSGSVVSSNSNRSKSLKFSIFVDDENDCTKDTPKQKSGDENLPQVSGKGTSSQNPGIPLHRVKSLFPEDLPKPYIPDTLLN